MQLFPVWIQRQTRLSGIFLANIFVSFHYFLVIYINSSFISNFVHEKYVSVLYLVAAVIGIGIFLSISHILKRFGNYKTTIATFVLEAVALLIMSAAPSFSLLVLAFVLHIALLPVLYLHLDIFLERYVKNERTTGGTRGVYLTMLNIAQVSSPFLVALIAPNAEFSRIYLVATAALVIAGTVVISSMRVFSDPIYSAKPPLGVLRTLFKNPEFFNAFSTHFLLRFFYAWMTVYAPLYLFRHIGFGWDTIGIMFGIMLIPFLILELPLGRLADTRFSERSIMLVGFVILAGTTALLSFPTTAHVILWTTLLIGTRIGASCVEIATESYFFKHVDGSHADTISFFRLTRPVAYVLAMAVASIATLLMPLQYTFIVLAVILLIGIKLSCALPQVTFGTKAS